RVPYDSRITSPQLQLIKQAPHGPARFPIRHALYRRLDTAAFMTPRRVEFVIEIKLRIIDTGARREMRKSGFGTCVSRVLFELRFGFFGRASDDHGDAHEDLQIGGVATGFSPLL